MKRKIRGQARVVLAAAAALVATVGIASPANAASGEQTCYLNVDTGEYYCSEVENSGFGSVSAAQLTASAVYTYAKLFEDSNYRGDILYITGSLAGGCGNGYSKTGNLPGDWNDRVSSYYSYLGCRVKLYQHTGLSGSSYGPYTYSSWVGSFNDEASSYALVD